MGNRRIILELDREPQDLQAVWRLDSIARLIQQALFISSANLTSYAMTLNMEMGVLIHSASFALEVSDRINGLISSGHFVERPNC